ncbi:hypothetical protein WDU94_005714 [Cyamophila willieti]
MENLQNQKSQIRKMGPHRMENLQNQKTQIRKMGPHRMENRQNQKTQIRKMGPHRMENFRIKRSNKKDGTTQNGKSTKPKDGVTEKGEKEKELDAKEKLSKEGGEFCQFEGMQHVCKELKISGREVYDKLAALSSLEDQVSYLFGLLEKVKFKNQFPVGKNDEVADWLRKKGNEFYNDGDTKTALDYYSLSLCMASNYSLQLAQAIGNKSACFADMDYPQAVATHIKVVLSQFGDLIPVALENKLMIRMENVVAKLLPKGSPPELHKKLLQSAFEWSPLDFRRSPYIVQPVLDFNALSTETFTGVENKPSFGENPKLPTMSSMVRLQYNAPLGRHLIAGRRIEPGDIIMRTSMGSASLYTEEYELSHCSYCLRFVTQLIPCNSCPFESFCDNFCLQLAQQSYHWALCGLIGELNYGPCMGHTKMNLALRLLMGHLSKYRGRMLDFMKEVSEYETEASAGAAEASSKGGGGDSNKSSFIPGVNKKGVYQHTDFRTVYYMWSKPDLLSSEKRQSLAISCAYNMQVIAHAPEFFKKERNLTAAKKSELKQFLTLLLYRIRVGLEWNCYEVTDYLQYTVRNFTNHNNPNFVIKSQERGIGLFFCSTLSLFNHACISNCVYTEQMNGTIIVRAVNTIEKGEQLTIPYFNYWSTPNSTKVQLLKEMGGFECQCVACTHNWDSDPNQAKQSFNDITITPMCFKCRTPKTIKPDKESKKCNKCKDVIDIKELREMVQSLVLASKIDATLIQITSRARLVQDLTILQGLQAMTLPHTCRELIALRRSLLYNLSRGDKCYVRPILRTDTMKGKLDIQDALDNIEMEKDVFSI